MLIGEEKPIPGSTAERPFAPRIATVLAAQMPELPRGAKLNAPSAAISLAGGYIDALNPGPAGRKLRIRLTHNDEVFETVGVLVYASQSLGMGVAMSEVGPEELSRLEPWLANPEGEYESRFCNS